MDLEPLTPNQLLLGRTGVECPDGEFAEADTGERRRVVTEMVRQWWAHWLSKGLPALLGRYKWTVEKPPPEVGDFVWIVGPQGRRYGKVVEQLPSRDGRVRAVKVQTKCVNESGTRHTIQGMHNVIVLARRKSEEKT